MYQAILDRFYGATEYPASVAELDRDRKIFARIGWEMSESEYRAIIDGLDLE